MQGRRTLVGASTTFLISDRLKERLADAKIHTEIFGSDHCPVELDMK
jgi:exodeoxyribonuclease-3